MIYKSVLCALCLWLARGVFGADADEVKSVSVMEGDSVTLHTDLTHIQTDIQILWTFKLNTRLAEIIKREQMNIFFVSKDVIFRDHLQMNNQTGSLTITNIKTEHSGLYQLQIISDKISFTSFTVIVHGVFGVGSDEVKSVSVMEADNVTLHTDLTNIQTDDQILWQCVNRGTRIAQIYKKHMDMFDSKVLFGDRLKLDSQTGSLTITKIRITDTGLYKLQIISDTGNSYKRFNVTVSVYSRLPVPVISRDSSQCSSPSERSSVSKCVLLCSVMNVTHVSLSWYKGNSLLSIISVSDLNIRLSIPLEVEYQDTNTYRCVINNPITNHTQHLDINNVYEACSGLMMKQHWVGITVFIVMLVMATAALGVLWFLYYRKTRHVVQTHDEADTTLSARQNEISVRVCVAASVSCCLCPFGFCQRFVFYK
ncbi:uncharacterized protein LOC130429537 isoform X1 [Triplophysa dalaica]|uniref:uncharacterized protein LOC130429537 isoform X1 n=1 Tax=Triplophysa dalaica TaxID=1582913 RepID=UPI0024DF47F3|nr:uncharacterized protein LOC130429537 isoform X1 [Triplophysa dalaica]